MQVDLRKKKDEDASSCQEAIRSLFLFPFRLVCFDFSTLGLFLLYVSMYISLITLFFFSYRLSIQLMYATYYENNRN